MAESREFRTMLETKERELIALCDQQIQSLNAQLREKDSAVAELKDQMSQLQDDFKYNLGLLDARDAELAQYDVSSVALEASVTESEERVKVARKALADAETLRIQENARADELEQISQQKISTLQKEIEGLQRSKEEMQAKFKQELESTKNELEDLHAEKVKELEDEHKKETDDATKKWKEKISKAEARLAESVENVESAEKKAEAADEKFKNLKKELDAARAKHKEDMDAAAQHEMQHTAKEEELKSIIDQQNKELEDLEKQLNQRKEDKDASAKKDANVNKDANMNKDANVTKDADVNKDANVTKDANVQAVDPPNNLKEQLQELKSHHTIAVDLFKGEIDSLRNKLESSANQTRTLEANLRKELEEKTREQKELEEKFKQLHDNYLDLQKELAGNKQHEEIAPQGMGLAGGGNGSSSSYPAASPLVSPGLSREDAMRINQGKLEAENSQLRARCEELSLQNDRIRDVVGTMRFEMEALQRQTKSPSRSPPSSPIKKRTGVKHLKEEVKYLKALVQDMSDELGDLRTESPGVHCRRPPQRQPTSPKRSGVSPIRQPKSSTRLRSPSRSRPSRSPHALMPTSPDSPHLGGFGDRVAEVEIVNSSLRAQLEAAKTDMARIIKERDLLMELSNGLRADLSKIMNSSGVGESAHNSHFGYTVVPPSLAAQFQQEFERETIPRNAKLMTGMSNPHDVAHATRPRTTSPGTTRFRSDAKSTEPSSKQWGYGVGRGETGENPVYTGLQMEGTSYRLERPQGVDNDPLHKGTNSQRARFKAAMKRKEELSRPKVRNWNIKDDHPLGT